MIRADIMSVLVITEDELTYQCQAREDGWHCGKCSDPDHVLNIRRVGTRCSNCGARVFAVREMQVRERLMVRP